MLLNCKIFNRVFLCQMMHPCITDDDGNECVMVQILSGPYKGNSALCLISDIENEDIYLMNNEKVKIIDEKDGVIFLQGLFDSSNKYRIPKNKFSLLLKSSIRKEIEKERA